MYQFIGWTVGWIPELINVTFYVSDYLIQKIGNDSVNYAYSGDVKVLVQFLENSILKILLNWKCVGGAYMRGCYTLKIIKYVYFITLVIFIYEIRGTHLILPQPTQF